MAAEVFEEPVEFEIAILEAVAPASPQYLGTSYPYPSLVPTSAIEKRTFRSVVLDNPFLRAVILPDLGGRLISLFDKRTQKDVLPLPTRLVPKAGSSRGAYVPSGIEIVSNGGARLNSLGVTSALLEHAEDDESPAGLWIGEVAGPLSFNALWSLAPDSAILSLEVRYLNRSLHAAAYNGGVSVSAEGGSVVQLQKGAGLYSTNADAGVALLPQDMPFEGTSYDGEMLLLTRAPHAGVALLAARQSDTWSVNILPWSGIGPAAVVSEAGALAWKEDRIVLQSAHRLSGHKLVLLTEAHGPLEAPLDVHPEAPYTVTFEALPSRPLAAAVLDSHKLEVLRFEQENEAAAPTPGFWDATAQALRSTPQLSKNDEDDALRSATSSVLTRTTAHLLLGAKRLSEQDFPKADAEFGDALLYNGNDPLAWWSKAVAKRLLGEEGEIAELLNAHYLAPLEPALRAESFFAQTAPDSGGPNPILAPLAESPDQFVDVACLLMHLGLSATAARFLDEALRHADLPMLRYLLAYVVSFEPQMEIEAAQHVKAAAALGFRPPYPWRREETTALRVLAARFPADELLKRFLDIAKESEATNIIS